VLGIQAWLWTMVVLVTVGTLVMSDVAGGTGPHEAAFLGCCIIGFQFMVGMSAGSAYLAANLQPGRAGIRRAAVAVEAFMACFGLSVAYLEASTGAGIIAGLPVTAGLVGTMLSLAASVALVSRSARSFTGRRGQGAVLSPG